MMSMTTTITAAAAAAAAAATTTTTTTKVHTKMSHSTREAQKLNLGKENHGDIYVISQFFQNSASNVDVCSPPCPPASSLFKINLKCITSRRYADHYISAYG
jgi:hypothetical protein